jgi:hypothetical protein
MTSVSEKPASRDLVTCSSSSFFYCSPVQSPEIVTVLKLNPYSDALIPGRPLPRHSGVSLATGIGPHYLEAFARFRRMLAPHQGAIATQEHSLGVFFPGTTNPVTPEAHSDGGCFSWAPPKMTAEFTCQENDVKQSCSLQIIKVLRSMFNLIRLPLAPVDESPQRLRVLRSQAASLLKFFVPLKPCVAGSDEMVPAQCVALKR